MSEPTYEHGAGFGVATINTNIGTLDLDWDGVLHTDEGAARYECEQARRAGHHPVLIRWEVVK